MKAEDWLKIDWKSVDASTVTENDMKKLIDSTPSLRDMREDYLLKNAARL
jgi:hypothetical protein